MDDSGDNVTPFPGATKAAHAAADRSLHDRHRVAPVSAVLKDVEEAIAGGGVCGLVVLGLCDDTLQIYSTHDRLLTEFALRSAAARLRL